jgi:hypothetical protein
MTCVYCISHCSQLGRRQRFLSIRSLEYMSPSPLSYSTKDESRQNLVYSLQLLLWLWHFPLETFAKKLWGVQVLTRPSWIIDTVYSWKLLFLWTRRVSDSTLGWISLNPFLVSLFLRFVIERIVSSQLLLACELSKIASPFPLVGRRSPSDSLHKTISGAPRSRKLGTINLEPLGSR